MKQGKPYKTILNIIVTKQVWLQHAQNITGKAPELTAIIQQAPRQKINTRGHTHLIPVFDFIST
jgi:hypothetical protein